MKISSLSNCPHFFIISRNNKKISFCKNCGLLKYDNVKIIYFYFIFSSF